MVEMVHDRIAAGETTVVSTAVVLRCRKQMEKLPHYNFSWTVSLQKQRKRPLGRRRRRWEDNIRMDLRKIRWRGMDWIDLAQDRDQWRALVNTVMNLRVP
jgi:hypothetical protein